MSTAGPIAPRMRSAVRLLAAPPVLVVASTLLPLLLFHVETAGSLQLALSVGADISVYAYALSCALAFVAAFAIFTQTSRPPLPPLEVSRKQQKSLRRWLTFLSLLLCAVGLFIVWLVLQSGIAEQLIKLIIEGGSDPDLRLKVIDNETIPGVVRMLGYLVLGSLVLFLGAVLARHEVVGRWLGFWPLLTVLMIAVVVRGLVFMDRVPTFGAGLLTLLVLAQRLRVRPRVLLPYALLGVTMLVFVAVLAQQQAGLRGGILLESNPVLLYADLGMANTSLTIASTTRFAYGFDSLLGPLLFIPRGLGLPDLVVPAANNAWVWDPASNLLAHAFNDFGPFGFLTYLIWGTVAGMIWKRHVRRQDSITWSVAYLWSILAILVIWTQPLTGGPDFWAGVIITLIAARKLDSLMERQKT